MVSGQSVEPKKVELKQMSDRVWLTLDPSPLLSRLYLCLVSVQDSKNQHLIFLK
jgi:hypothetical protein